MKKIFPLIFVMFTTSALANDHYWPYAEHHQHHHNNIIHNRVHHEHEHHYRNHSSSHLHGDAGTSQQHLPH